MKIVVLDYCTSSCDILENVSDELIDKRYDGDIEWYLTNECGYSTNNISWMSGENIDVEYIDKS